MATPRIDRPTPVGTGDVKARVRQVDTTQHRSNNITARKVTLKKVSPLGPTRYGR
jgi:hypothetical protein